MNSKKESLLIDRMYTDTIEDLRGVITDKFGSIKKFCETEGMPEETNLSRIFSKKSNRCMSIGLYIRILIALGLVDKDAIIGETLDLKLSLKLYLKIDHTAVFRSINTIPYL